VRRSAMIGRWRGTVLDRDTARTASGLAPRHREPSVDGRPSNTAGRRNSVMPEHSRDRIVALWGAGAEWSKVFPCSALGGGLHPRPQGAPTSDRFDADRRRVAEDHRRLHSGRLLRARTGPPRRLVVFGLLFFREGGPERAHRYGRRNTSRPSRRPRLVEVNATNKRDAPRGG